MSIKETAFVWKVYDKEISLNRDSGILKISTKVANHFSFLYGDPRKMAEALHEIADALLQCQHVDYDADDHPVRCDKLGTVRREYGRSGDSYMPAHTLCDDHAMEPREPVAGSESKLRTVAF
jgi:hypothetical protein